MNLVRAKPVCVHIDNRVNGVMRLSDGRDVHTTHHVSPRDPRRCERIAENTYRRVTKSGMAVYEVVFRDVDGRQRTRRLQARTERAAIREARGVLVGRDGGQRVVPANVTIDGLANDEWFPLLDSLV